MSLLALIRGNRGARSEEVATATPATQGLEQGPTVAIVATVAVAEAPEALSADVAPAARSAKVQEPRPQCVEPEPTPGFEERRSRVLAMLAASPALRYALVTDTEAEPEAVMLALAIREAMPDGSTVTCELRIPREKYDPFLLLELIERHGGTVH